MSPLKPYQSKIIVLLTQRELLVAELYRFFAGRYPDQREFGHRKRLEVRSAPYSPTRPAPY